jgi:hypothetical protein
LSDDFGNLVGARRRGARIYEFDDGLRGLFGAVDWMCRLRGAHDILCIDVGGVTMELK